LEVLFEITQDRKIKLSVEVGSELKPGEMLEWVPAAEIINLPQEEIKKEEVPKADTSVAVTRQEADLHDIWVLTSAAQAKIDTEQLARKPVLELHVKEGTFMGQAPCNHYSGKLTVSENSAVKFENTVSTKMACG